MLRGRNRLFTVLAVLVIYPTLAFAAGSATPSRPTLAADARTPQELAAASYQRGLGFRDKAHLLLREADELDNRLVATAGARDRKAMEKSAAKLRGRAKSRFRDAIKRYRAAISRVPGMHEAHASLGYALKQTGHFEAALDAYHVALSLAPDYTEAIEYRGETYLALHRYADVKEAYLKLFRHNRAHAAQLLAAAQTHLAENVGTSGSGSVANAGAEGVNRAEERESLGRWVTERQKVVSQTADLEGPQDSTWQ